MWVFYVSLLKFVWTKQLEKNVIVIVIVIDGSVIVIVIVID